jgi:hypothetical protein
MKIIDKFYDGDNFIGYLVCQDGKFYFGYDVENGLLKARYHVYSFKSLEEFFTFLSDNYPNIHIGD